SPDGKTLSTSEQHSGTLHRWEVPAGVLKAEPAGHANRPNRVSFSPKGDRVATSGSMDGTIIIWDLKTAKPLVQLREREWVRSCTFSPDGRLLIYSTTGDTLTFADAANGKKLHQVKVADPDRPKTNQSGLDMHLSRSGKALISLSSSRE